MKYSLLIAALLSAFSIVNAQEVDAVATEVVASPVVVAKTPAAPAPIVLQAQAAAPAPIIVQVPAPTPIPACTEVHVTADTKEEAVVSEEQRVRVNVVGQGVSPMNTVSPAQAYALAKRAAIADAYRIIAEKVKGVRVEGQDLVRNMMIKRSTVRTSVNAMVRNANIVETVFKDGLCEVEMEIVLSYSDFSI